MTTVHPVPVQQVAPPPAAPPPVRVNPGAVLGVIAAGALGALGLWWAGTPSVTGFGGWLTDAGRITGLLAGYGFVVLVALMARIPPLERGIGADKLARWHAMGGRYVVSLIVAHGLLITWGYAVSAHTGVLDQSATLLLTYPDVLAATVAGLLLVGVGISSARAARRRLRYETWYFLHFYTYLAMALAFSHQFATGAQFMDDRTARTAWSTLYVLAGAAILWYRFVTPVRQAFRHRLRVESVSPEAAGVVSVVVTGRHLDELRAEAGQFFRWRFLTRDLWWVSAPYSLSAPASGSRLRITVKALGDHSAALAALKPGTRVVTEGPYGAMTPSARRERKVLLVAGGSGITPIRALFQALPAAPGDLTLVYRARREADVVFREELEQLAADRGARLWILTGTRAEHGGDPLTLLRRHIPDIARHDVYVCGPPGMADAVHAELRAARVPRRQIHHESFEF
ncbi:ferredoxin reductase family protein [Amycolatopsis sp. NPDC051371]|uniref:ferredoxin reductase family protein n=1 Tax=Amycolatopsis sp. NPDC051371 TaxID=3155800 RepID=UPI00344A40D4